MKESRPGIAWSILLGGVLPLIVVFLCKTLMPEWKSVHEAFHSVFEALGCFAGLLLASLLLLQLGPKKSDSHYIWVILALITMGLLDGIHASVGAGNTFVWLHTIAVLSGGLLFSMTWLPVSSAQPQITRRIAALVAALAVITGVVSLLYPQMLPVMMTEGKFSSVASSMHGLGGALFVVGAVFFLVRYWSLGEMEDVLFSFFCLLNGSAALVFFYGQPWDANWWLWHLMRLIAYFVLLGYVFSMFADLTARQRMSELLEKRTDALTRLVGEVKETVNVLTSSSAEIMAATTQVAAGAAETSSAISETTTTVEEVRQAAQLSAQKAAGVSERAQRVAQVSQDGKKAVDATMDGMRHIRDQMESIAQTVVRLSEQSQAIGGIIASVTDIADQSKLLAVNAAIEAARAGEQGKGFAVVAQEIKSLAEQSKQATAQVRDILNEVQKATGAAVMATEQGSKAVDAGVKQSAQAGEAIQALASSTTEAAQSSTQIAASSQQQVVGMNQIGTAMESINQAAAQTSASMKQAETAAQNLHEMGQKLKALVDKPQT